MRWKCEACDTYNDEGTRECFVCGEPRSEASIMAEKQAKLEKKREKRYRIISKHLYRTFKIFYLASLSFAFLVVIAIFLTIILNSSVDSIIRNLTAIFSRFGAMISNTFGSNLPTLLKHIIVPVDFAAFSKSIQAIWNCILSKFTAAFGLGHSIAAIVQKIAFRISSFCVILLHVISIIWQSTERIPTAISHIINSAKRHIY